MKEKDPPMFDAYQQQAVIELGDHCAGSRRPAIGFVHRFITAAPSVELKQAILGSYPAAAGVVDKDISDRRSFHAISRQSYEREKFSIVTVHDSYLSVMQPQQDITV